MTQPYWQSSCPIQPQQNSPYSLQHLPYSPHPFQYPQYLSQPTSDDKWQPISHNQTHSWYKRDVEVRRERSLPPETGVAIFLVPDPEKGVHAQKSVVVDGLYYDDAVLRGENCKTFKWLPHSVATLDDYKAYKLAPPCYISCSSSDQCHPFCFCFVLGPLKHCLPDL
ncbi:hypothetical protein [Lysinibacillus sphaericus]|uniref:hypothetical protein n=1 Tax=Lysinibacillus sphaericus TaxID=1421 RepID=UPI00056D931B|nr:hypothetical protein [Lysinibacillus sphaericus]